MQNRRNIIFIVIDTHRRDRLGMYGYGRGTSPNLDEFARRATIFENAISPAQWTIPSHASMFTGEYPNTHLTTQASHSVDPYFRTLAERLGEHGYQCVGFCNNPLVGVLDNDLKRGFETLYNYGGAIPSTPARANQKLLKPLSQVWERYTQLLRKISYPIQNAFARSDRMFKLSLNPIYVPLWTKFANFKGDTAKSLQDATTYLQSHLGHKSDVSQFVFINLMETHLPFKPPENFVRRFAPYFHEERAARDFLRVYNTLALRWLLPMDEPFSELEARVLSDLYDAEVAYQDHLLNPLLETLDSPYHRENTLVILVSDHGEMLGEHNLMGHGFRVYQELVHVPLAVRFPVQMQGMRVTDVVSTLQLFHTVLDIAGVPWMQEGRDGGERLDSRVDRLSLKRFGTGATQAEKAVFSEAHPPQNVLKIMETNFPALIERFNSRAPYRAAYDQNGYKIVRSPGLPDALFNLRHDPGETRPQDSKPSSSPGSFLGLALERFLEQTEERRPDRWSRRDVHMTDEKLAKRLRALGYLE